MLIAILRTHGDLRGTVIDLVGPVARAELAGLHVSSVIPAGSRSIIELRAPH